MSNKNPKFYISTAIPYVNSAPHLGFALEIVQTDVLARYHRLKGDDVFFLTGTDENALKNVLAAKESRVGVKEFVDRNAEKFKELKKILNLSSDDFIRTTESRHIAGAQKFWLKAQKDIYKKKYKGLYCVGCEEFKTEKDLANGHCPEHPNIKIETVEEENYFFRLSQYQDQIKKIITSGRLEVIPETRKNEMLAFIDRGLEDFSISRSKERAQGWGIPVPGDDTHIQYVWFDALTNYITALGYADDSDKFKKYWTDNENILHVIGKGVTRFHAIYWPAMLFSAGVRIPRKIFVHGYVTFDGQKLSKSLGNVIDPVLLVKKYGIDPVRYYLLREISSYEDGDFSYKKFEERYNGDLANGLGNLVARVSTIGEKLGSIEFNFKNGLDAGLQDELNKILENYERHIAEIRLNEALGDIWQIISLADRYINEKKIWSVKDKNLLIPLIISVSYLVIELVRLLEPFLPETAGKIKKQFIIDGSSIIIQKGENLFPRLK